MKYEPLFNFFVDEPGKRFEIIHDDGDYVTTDSGTGIVHMAPYYGAEDDDLCKKFGIIGVNPISKRLKTLSLLKTRTSTGILII